MELKPDITRIFQHLKSWIGPVMGDIFGGGGYLVKRHMVRENPENKRKTPPVREGQCHDCYAQNIGLGNTFPNQGP